MKLSTIVITHNEETNIERCLRSVAFADERIVIDAESSDATRRLAEQAGARVLVKAWSGFGPQKNFGLEQAASEWALFIDADEEVTADLRRDIEAVINSDTMVPVWWLKITTVFLKRPLWHLRGHNPRLFRKDQARWTAVAVHEQVALSDGTVVTLGDHHSRILESALLHHSHTTVASYLTTMHTYTTLDAKQMLATHTHRNGRRVAARVWLPWLLSGRQFIKLFCWRRGFLDGWVGLVWCSLSAFYEWEMARKYLSLAKNKSL